jgi:hypothetical protein
MAGTKAQKPKYQVVDDVFIAQTDQGEVKIRLGFKTKLLRSIRNTDGDEIDQIFALLDGIGDKKTSAQIDELDIFDTTDLVSEFFKAFEEKQNARLGEASASSAS